MDAEIKQIERTRDLFFNPKIVLHHYTTIAASHNIIESQQFFLSNIDYLNDHNEHKYGINLFLQEIRERNDHRPGDESLRILTQVMNEQFHFTDSIYIASFSAAGDDLYQWRAYGQQGSGVAIGFKPEAFANIQSAINGRIAPCIYNQNEQRQIANILIDDYDEKVRDGFPGEDKNNRTWGPFDIATATRNKVLGIASLFKDQRFEHEQEWRLIGWSPNGRVRLCGHRLVPYINWDFRSSDSHSPISIVTIGPCAERELVRNAMEKHMNISGHRYVSVRTSTLPLRF